MAVPDFINQLESTYIDIRRCSGLDRAETIAFFYRWMMITNAIVLININVFFSWRLKKKIMNVLLTVQSTRSCY